MKRLLPVALLLFVCSPVMAGDIIEPGKQPPPPPPPTNQSTTTTTPEDGDTLLTELALWLLTLVKP